MGEAARGKGPRRTGRRLVPGAARDVSLPRASDGSPTRNSDGETLL